MKKGYEKKIDTLVWDNERIKKDKARQILEMKNKIDQEIKTKNLILKKLSCYVK